MPRQKGGIFIAIYHCSIKIISRGKGKSAVAAAAYRSGEKLINNYDGITHDYTKKGGVAYTEIILPSHAPPEFSDRSVLWNSVEKIEKSKNSQLAREIEIALPKELNSNLQTELVREYVTENFISVGMCVDFAIHDKQDGNPHAHIMLTMRPIEIDGSWGAKSKKEYVLDKKGERIKLKNGYFKTRKIDTIDWNDKEKAELWRSKWAEVSNKYLAKNTISERIDHRSFERQGVEQIPTIHLGVVASQMEQKGIDTERGSINREIKATNKFLAEIMAKIASLKKWLADIFKHKEKPTSEKNIMDYLNGLSKPQKINMQYRIYDPRKLAIQKEYVQENGITTMSQLDEKIKSTMVEYEDARNAIKSTGEKLRSLRGTDTDIAKLTEQQEQLYSMMYKLRNNLKIVEGIKRIVEKETHQITRKRNTEHDR